MESGEDFQGGWLPTLDTTLRVEEDNSIMYRHYEKETTTNQTVQKSSAMEENCKIQILANDLVRRLGNTQDDRNSEEISRVVDGYGQKLLNSGFSLDQTRNIIVKGIKEYELRKLRCIKEGRSYRRTANESRASRSRGKLLSKTSWYKSRKKEDLYEKSKNGKRKKSWKSNVEVCKQEQKSVMFVEQTEMGELAKRLREMVTRLAPIMGFSVKIIERTGSTLRSKFPQSSLWEGAPCGRSDCVTCLQGAEFQVPCSRKSMVYENICGVCNKGASGKDEVVMEDPTIPSIYVGESSRTIRERAKEHWSAYRGSQKSKDGSHIYKHQELYHRGEEPTFYMRTVQFYKSALSRQTAEAVRIARRGGSGSVLNSKSEYNRSFIPRLTVIEEDEVEEMEALEEQAAMERREEIDDDEECWKERKKKSRAEDIRRKKDRNQAFMKKRNIEDEDQEPTRKRSKRLKYEVLENWGMGEECMNEQEFDKRKTTGQKWKTTSEEECGSNGARNQQRLLDDSAGVGGITPGVSEDTSTIIQVGEDDSSNTPLEMRNWKPSSILEHFPKIGGGNPSLTIDRPRTEMHRGADKFMHADEDKTVGGSLPTPPPVDQHEGELPGDVGDMARDKVGARGEELVSGEVEMSPHLTPSSVSDRKLVAAGRQQYGEDDIQDERGTHDGMVTSNDRDDPGDECGQTSEMQNECEDTMIPLVKLEGKPSGIISNVEAGKGELKGDAKCLLDKDGTRCTTHDCSARMVTTYHKRWQFRPKRKDYGYVSAKLKRVFCSSRKYNTGHSLSGANNGDLGSSINVCSQQRDSEILHTFKEGGGISQRISGSSSKGESTQDKEIIAGDRAVCTRD